MNPEALAALRAEAMGDAADVAFGGHPVPVDYDDEKDEFVFHVRPLETDRARLVVGARHVRSQQAWRCPASRSQAAALSGVFDGRLEPTERCRKHVHALFSVAAFGEQVRAGQAGTLRHGWDSSGLFAFQGTGVEFLYHAGSALLGDEMGTGKTVQALTWMHWNDQDFVHEHEGMESSASLVVCPNSMKYKWAAEAEIWWPEAHVIVIDGGAAKRRKQIAEAAEVTGAPVLFIINYESLRTHTRLAPWGGKALTEKQKLPKELNEFRWLNVVVDEAHKIKDPKAQQTMAVKQMGLQADHRLAMTGTPLLNNPDDIWSIMNFVAPEEWGSRNQFRNRYCRMQSAWHGGYENLGLKPEVREEFDRFFVPRFIRRTKVEVLPDLPEKLPIDYRVIPMTSKQAKVYKALSEDMMALVGDELLTVENGLGLAIRLRQVAAATPVVNDDGDVVALEAPSNKLDAIQDLLSEAPGEPLVVYAESRKFIELLADHFRKQGLRVGLVTGAQGAKERERHVKAFQDGKLDLMLGTLGAGAEGITLTRANRIVLAQQDWSHAVNAQAIDRIHRIGQDRGVHPIVLISEGTIDHAVAMVDRTKEGRLQELVRDPSWMRSAARGEIR